MGGSENGIFSSLYAMKMSLSTSERVALKSFKTTLRNIKMVLKKAILAVHIHKSFCIPRHKIRALGCGVLF